MARFRILIIAMLRSYPLHSFADANTGKWTRESNKNRHGQGYVTLIRDVKNDQQNPEYAYLPALSYSLPKNPADNGGGAEGRHADEARCHE